MKRKPQPPSPPPARKIIYNPISFFGFKPTKVKHAFFIITYVSSLVLTFLHIIVEQDIHSVGAYWFVANVYIIGVTIIIHWIISLIKNWNKEL